MKRILLILTGGTIASVETEQGLRPGISEEELRESLVWHNGFLPGRNTVSAERRQY